MIWALGPRVRNASLMPTMQSVISVCDESFGIRGSYYDIPKAIFYALKGDSRL